MRYNTYYENSVMNHIMGDIVEVDGKKDVKFRKLTTPSQPTFAVPSDRDRMVTDIHHKEQLRVVRTSHDSYRFKLAQLEAHHDVYGNIDPVYQSISKEFGKNIPQISNIVKYHAYDIEVFDIKDDDFPDQGEAKCEIKLITLVDSITGKAKIWGYKDYTPKDMILKSSKGEDIIIKADDIEYFQKTNERMLLMHFLHWVDRNVQILIGHNSNHFDNTTIIHRCERLHIKHRLVNDAVCRQDKAGNWDAKFNFIQNLDFMDMAKKYKGGRDSYKLEMISRDLLGTGKLDMPDFKDQYINHYDHFVDYGLVDSILVIKCNEKWKFVEFMITIANMFHGNMEDVLSVSRTWDSRLYNKLRLSGIAIPPKEKKIKNSFEGGWVKAPPVGMGGMGTLYDITSSYPNNMIRHNISPDRLVPYEELPVDLLQQVLKLRFTIAAKEYANKRFFWKSEKSKGSKWIRSNREVPDKVNVLFYNIEPNYENKINFPNFIVVRSKKEIKSSTDFFIKKIYSDEDIIEYLYFPLTRTSYHQQRRKYLRGCQLFAVNRQWITKGLINHFISDLSTYKPFTELLYKYDLIMTPNLQFFTRKSLGVIPSEVETVFFERVKHKRKAQEYTKIKSMVKPVVDRTITKKDIIDSKVNKFQPECKDMFKRLLTEKKDMSEELSVLIEIENLLSNALKIEINSIYGLTGDNNFRYFDIRLAESTTASAQMLRGCALYIERECGVVWKYQDTDSILFSYPPITDNDDLTLDEKYDQFKTFLETVVEPKINEYYRLLGEASNVFEQHHPLTGEWGRKGINLEREVITEKGYFNGKKQYYWNIIELDGKRLDAIKPKIKGLSIIKRDTPLFCRKHLQHIFGMMMNRSDAEYICRKYVRYVKQEFMKQDVLDIGKPVGATIKEDATLNVGGIPPHIKGALIYNKYLRECKLDKKYKQIHSRDKVIMLYLKSKSKKMDNVNAFRSNALSLPADGVYPKGILEHVEIDKEKLFETTFLKPVRDMFTNNKWKL